MTTTEMGKALGSRILAARKQRGFTGADFARDTGITATTLWRYESGSVVAGAEILARMARRLEVSLDWLISGEGDGPNEGRRVPAPANDATTPNEAA